VALRWSISHDDRLVVAHITDAFVLADVPVVYAAIIAEGGLSYRKLVDLTLVPIDIAVLDIGGISRAVRAATNNPRRGPVAFIVPNDAVHDMVEIFDRKTALDRPLGIFRDRASAMRWLDEIAPVAVTERPAPRLQEV
jgi:hypothetical protein